MTISPAQLNRLLVLLYKSGKHTKDLKYYLSIFHGGVEPEKILITDYNEICRWAESKTREPGEEG